MNTNAGNDSRMLSGRKTNSDQPYENEWEIDKSTKKILYIYKSATMQIKSALYPGLTVVIIMQNRVKQFLLCPIIWIQKAKSLY